MTVTLESKDSLNIEFDPQTWGLIERAAILRGQTPGDFTTAVLVEEAESVLRGEGVRQLSERDAVRFVELLDAAPAPNAALIGAAQRYKARHG